MKVFDKVKKVKCKENVCKIEHRNIKTELDVGGIMLSGKNIVKGDETEVEFEKGKCKVYDDILVCKEKERW